MKSKTYLLLSALCNLLILASAQDGTLPDSISNIDCMTMQANSPHICCDSDTGDFCRRQCNNGICQCVDPATGVPVSGSFPENDESANCDPVVVPGDEVTTTEQVTTTEATTTAPMETVTEPEIITTEEDPEDESSDSSDTSESEETSFSDSDSTDESTSGTTGTNNTRSDSSRSGSSSSETTGTNDTRSDSSRSGSTGTNDTRSDSSRSGSSRSGTTDSGSGELDYSDSKSISRSDSDSRCSSVRRLLSKGCIQSCVLEGEDGCPSCNRTCLQLALSEGNLPQQNTCDCTDTQVCLRVGRFGKQECVDLLAEGDRCDGGSDDENSGDEGSGDEDSELSISEDSESSSSSSTSEESDRSRASARRRVGGARDRYIFGTLNDAAIGCQEGLTCVDVGMDRSECRPNDQNGPCPMAQQEDMSYECASDGSFEPLQCRPEVGDLLRCFCVNPDSGAMIPSTETVVTTRDDAPDCASLVGCTVIRAGQAFNVPHGDFFVNVDDCERCLCNNGEATMCERSVCTALQRSPPTCNYEGQSYTHGETFQVDCNTCGCRNGEIRCTRQQCAEFVLQDRCQECLSAPREEVCGINGVTYPSSCVSVFCAGLAPFDVRRGNCPSTDVCTLYPCDEGELCLRRGGVTCLGADGCDPDDLRICVNTDSLMCANIPEENPENSALDNSTAVCGTNGVTYSSLCQLIQDTGNEAVAYAGPCDRRECQGGPVCGTDGVTYENVCKLRAQSANARVDFLGACEDGLGRTPEEYCTMVSRARRCIFDTSNCRHLVRPEEGCCALCGGIVFVAIDRAGLSEYVRINPRVRTLDAFAEVLVDSGFINDEITERCELELSLTRTGNIQITLSAEDDEDAAFCNEASERLAAAINDPSSVSDEPRFAQIPEILQFASAAVTAPNAAAITMVTEEVTESRFNGAPLVKALSYLTLLLLVAATAIAV